MITFAHVDKYFYFQHQRTLKELLHAFVKGQKTLEYVHALSNVSFFVKKGESVGIIGKNGAGKSTLLKLIAGVSAPTKGTIAIEGKVAPLIELGAGFHPELTGIENIFLNGVILGLKEKEVKEKLQDIIAFSELEKFMDVPVKFYSSGMYMRLAFSVAIHVSADILLIDEILAVGDSEFQKKCMDKMEEFKKNGTTIVLVSHDTNMVKRFCSRVIYLKNGTVSYDGPVEDGIKEYTQTH